MILNENDFEDLPEAEVEETITVSTEPEDAPSDIDKGPIVGPETGVADLLMNLIKDEYEAIQGYNTFLSTIKQEGGFDDMIETIEHINTEENKHIGELTTLLNLISPNVENQEEGKAEAEEEIGGMNEGMEFEKKVQPVVDLQVAAALDSNEKKKEQAEKVLKAEDKLPQKEPFLGTGKNNKKVSNPNLKKLHLSEELFEDFRG